MPERAKLSFDIVAAADGVGRLSDPTGAYVPPVQLNPVTNLRITNNTISSQTCEWDWSDSNHEGFEHRYFVTGDSAWRPATALSAGARSIVISGLPDNTSIGHRVRAVATDSDGPWSEVWETTIADTHNPDPPDDGAFVYQKMGWGDFDTDTKVFMRNSGARNPRTGSTEENWGRWWGVYNSSALDLPGGVSQIAMLEDQAGDRFENVYPASAFSNSDDFQGSRPLKFRLRGEIEIDCTGIPKTGTLYITIRYKDQVIPGRYAGCSFHTGRHQELIGTLGGQNDHRWKTTQFQVNGSDMVWLGNWMHCSFGEEYSDEHNGQLNIDRIKVSTTNNLHEFPPDEPGMWQPLDEPNKHANIYNDHEWYSGETPKFRYGIYMEIGLDLGADATASTHSNVANDQFQTCEDVGMNCCVQHMWYTTLDNHWRTFPGEPAPTGCQYIEGGTEEWAVQAAGHGMEYIPNTLTNIWPEVQSPSKSGSAGLYEDHMDFVAEADAMLSRHVGDTRIPCINWKDELDHDGTRDKYPIEAQRMLYARTKNSDPNRAVYCSMMGFHGTKSWEFWADVYDICGCDAYFDDSDDGTWSGLEKGIRTASTRLHYARPAVRAKNKLLIYIPHASEGSNALRDFPGGPRVPNQLEIVMQLYLGICHGAKGAVYFRYDHPTKALPGIGSMWNGLAQVGDELFGANGIEDIVMAPSVELDCAGENGIATTGAADMHWILQQRADGKKFLIALNGLHSSRTVQFNIAGISDGSKAVRFEGRNVTVSGGKITDSFSDWERHVYELG